MMNRTGTRAPRLYAAILALLLLSSLFVFPAAAEDGKPVSSAEEFYAMDADGIYYLTADITVEKSYTRSFTGEFNGKGHTVTVSAPLFSDLRGTVRELTIEGEILTNTEPAAALAVNASGMRAYRVINNASVTAKKALRAGGFIAQTAANGSALFVDCVNNGSVTLQIKSGDSFCGGFCGCCDTLEAYGCVNNGSVSAASTTGICGGFAARCAYTALINYACLEDCVNTGSVSALRDAAGFIGYIGCSGNIGIIPYVLRRCENSGDISGRRYSGGLVGYVYGSGSSEYMTMEYCLNSGSVTGGYENNSAEGFVSEFTAYCNSVYTTAVGCIGCGDLLAREKSAPRFVFIGVSSANYATDENIRHNYLADNDVCKWFTYATADTNDANRIPMSKALTNEWIIRLDRSQIASGEAAFRVNREARLNIFDQQVGEGSVPTLTGSAPHVMIDEVGGYYSTDFQRFDPVERNYPYDDYDYSATDPAPETEPVTEAPAVPVTDTPAQPETASPEEGPSGGCASVSVSGFAAAAAAAVVFLFRKKRRDAA